MNLVVTARTGISARENQPPCRDLHIADRSLVVALFLVAVPLFWNIILQEEKEKRTGVFPDAAVGVYSLYLKISLKSSSWTRLQVLEGALSSMYRLLKPISAVVLRSRHWSVRIEIPRHSDRQSSGYFKLIRPHYFLVNRCIIQITEKLIKSEKNILKSVPHQLSSPCVIS